MMIVEQSVECRLAGETEVLGENLPHFVHHKSHMTRPRLEPRAAAVGSQRLTAWAMARPSLGVICPNLINLNIVARRWGDWGSDEVSSKAVTSQS
jgi:hypothetical protein